MILKTLFGFESNKDILKSIKEVVLAKELESAATKELTALELVNTIAKKNNSKEDAKSLLLKSGLITSTELEENSTVKVTSAKIQELVATNKLTKAEAELISAKLGVSAAGVKENSSLLAGLSGVGAKLGSVGSAITTLAMAHPIIAGIAAVLAICAGAAIANKVAQVKSAKEIKEAYEGAKTAVDEIESSFKKDQDTVKDISERYAELAQEVENLGEISQSQGTLNTEEYNEFLDLSNQLAGIFPSLTKNYDENGNAILNLSGNVDTIVGSLNNLIQAERQLANQKIMEEFPDIFAGYMQNMSSYEEEAKKAKKEFDAINNAYNKLRKGESVQLGFNNQGYNTSENIHMGDYISWIETLGLTYEKMMVDGGYVVSVVGDINDAFSSELKSAKDNLDYANQQLEGEKSSIDSYLNTWLQGEFAYNQIEESGLQDAVQEILFNFDFSNLPDNIDKNNWGQVSEYLRRNILFAINNAQEDEDISKALSEVFSNTELMPDDKANYITQIQKFFGEDNVISLVLNPILGDTEVLQKQVDSAIEEAKKLEEDFDWDSWFEENSINTEEEIDKWNEIADAANNAAEARDKYINGEQPKEVNLFEGLKNSKESIEKFTSSVNSAYEAYSKLLSPNISSSDLLNSIMSINESVSEMGGEINWEFIESSKDPLGLLGDLIGQVSEKYADSVLSGAGIDVVNSEFGQMLKNNIVQAQQLKAELDNYNSTTDSIQSSFSTLTNACEEYNEHGYLTADTLQEIISLDSEYLACLIDENGQLQVNGQTYDALVQAKLADAQATAVKQAIAELDRISTEGQIDADTTSIGIMAEKQTALANLSGEYGHLAGAAISAATAQALADSYSEASSKNQEKADQIMAALDAKLALIQETMSKTANSFGNLTNHLNGFSDASGDAKDATDSLKEAIQQEIDALEKQKDALEESLNELDELYDAIQWYLDGQIEEFDDIIEKIQEENDALAEQREIYDNILSVVESVYNDEIEAIREKIDALDKENDEKEKAIALEKARQKVEEMRNNKKILQYTADRGYIYTVDEVGLKEAEDEYADLAQELEESKIRKELEDQIELLEKYRDMWGEIPEAFEKSMNELEAMKHFGADWKNAILNSDEGAIGEFQGNYTGLQENEKANEDKISYYEEEKKKIEDLKELWEDAKNAYRDSQYEAKLASFFGSDYEHQILNNSLTWRTQFTNEYCSLQMQIADIEERIKALNEQSANIVADSANKVSTALNQTTDAVNGLKESIQTDGSSGNLLSGIETSVDNTLIQIESLKTALSDLDLARKTLKETIDADVVDTSNLVGETHTKVIEIKDAISELLDSISLLKTSIEELFIVLTNINDTVTLENVIAQIGMGEESESLLGAITSVINKLSGENEGLLYELNQLNEKQLDLIIAEFNGDESLLSAIRDVSSAILSDGDECLISKINKITETIGNIDTVKNSFNLLESQIDNCVIKVDTLNEKIQSLQDKTVTITVDTVVNGTSGVTDVFGNSYSNFTYGRATGGIIGKEDENDLDHFARAAGEDHMVALTEGEAVIPVDTVKSNPELVNNLLNANGKSIGLSSGISYKVAGESFNKNGNTFTPVNVPNLFGSSISGFNLDKVAPKYENKMNPESYMNTVNNENSVSITIGDIHLSGVQDVNGLSNAIINKLPNTLIQALGRI